MRTLTNEEKAWTDKVLNRVSQKMTAVTKRNRGIIPYTTRNGRFDDKTGGGDNLVDQRLLGRRDVAAL